MAGRKALRRVARDGRGVLEALLARTADKRRKHDLRNVFRVVFVAVAVVGVPGVLTRQYVGGLFSLGIVGFAGTYALHQPPFSLIGWLYITVSRPCGVGDRVAIEGSKGDVVEVDFVVTTLWEIDGELVSTHQPSERVITLPNSVVLSSHVHDYSYREFPRVWNELSVQVASETDRRSTSSGRSRGSTTDSGISSTFERASASATTSTSGSSRG